MYEADVITVRLHYKREKEMSVAEMLALGDSRKDEAGHRRVLEKCPVCKGAFGLECGICQGTGCVEDKNPFPQWCRDVLELHGYKWDYYNTDYTMKVRGRNDRKSNDLAQAELEWLRRVTRIISCPWYFARFWRGLWFFKWTENKALGLSERPLIRLLAPADVSKCAQWARISSKLLVSEDEHDAELEAEDRKKEKEAF